MTGRASPAKAAVGNRPDFAYIVGDGWCFCCGGFASHVKLTFGRGTSLKPVPPVTPIGFGGKKR